MHPAYLLPVGMHLHGLFSHPKKPNNDLAVLSLLFDNAHPGNNHNGTSPILKGQTTEHR